jgi:hypothetical protein
MRLAIVQRERFLGLPTDNRRFPLALAALFG